MQIPRRMRDKERFLEDQLTCLWSVVRALEGNLFHPEASLGLQVRAKLTLVDPSVRPPLKATHGLGLQMQVKLQAQVPVVKSVRSTNEIGIDMVVRLTKVKA